MPLNNLNKKPTYKELEKLIKELKSESNQTHSENYFNMILKASEDVITVHKPFGKYVYYNGPKCYTIAPEDIVGKMPKDLFNEEVSKTLLNTFKKVAKTGESETIEILIDWLGEKKWFSEYIYPIKNAAGEVVEIVKICRDIHKRKVAEQELEKQNKALLESEKSYKDVLKASCDLITVIDKKGKIKFINHASKKFYGLSPEECLGKLIFDFIHPEDIKYTKAKFIEWEDSKSNNFNFENKQINIFGDVIETEWSISIERKENEIIKITSIIRDITKQNITHQELIKANKEREQFFYLFKLSPDIMTIADPKGIFKSVNPATTKLLGFLEEELISKRFVDFIHPDDKMTSLREINSQIKVNATANHACRFLCKNNEYLLLSCSIYFNEKEGVTYTTARDITNERLNEIKLIKSKEHAEKSEERFRLLMLNMEAGIVVHAPDTSIILNNIKASKILGLSEKQMKGKKSIDPAWKFVKPDKSPLPFAEYPVNKIANSKKSIKSEVLGVLHPNKSDIVWVMINGYAATNNTGEITEIVISFIDITEQKHIEEDKLSVIVKLKNSENRLNQTQKLAQIGSWFSPLPRSKVEWSEELFHIWGLDPKKGTPLHDYLVQKVHPDDLELFNSSYNKAAYKGIPYDVEFRIFLPNGDEKTLRSFCQPIKGTTGEIISLLGANMDITSQKLFEKAQVKHQRLKAIGEMSSSIAHDFNNSLQQMMGNVEVIKIQKNLSKTTLERLNNIAGTIDDVAGRVSALQKFGDTENDEKDLQLIDFNLLIKESLNQSRPLWKDDMGKKGLSIHVITDFKEIPKFIGNKGELKSAVYNLIKNSIEAMPEGGNIIIKTGTRAKHIFATFTDTGLGMDEAIKRKVFEPFFTTKGFELGRGLGMSGVYSTVKKFKGNIVVKSSGLSEGTTFEIVFPISHQKEIKLVTKKEQCKFK
jgi:PAS domain S-box-containing protein